MTLHMKDGGSWKTATPYVRDGGAWKAPAVYVKDAGVWKLVHSPVSVSISPPWISDSNTSASWIFGYVNAIVTGGTATSYTWYLQDQTGGFWSINAGQGTSSCQVAIDFAPSFELCTATLLCDVVVNGQTYTISCNLSYQNTSVGGGGFPGN